MAVKDGGEETAEEEGRGEGKAEERQKPGGGREGGSPREGVDCYNGREEREVVEEKGGGDGLSGKQARKVLLQKGEL